MLQINFLFLHRRLKTSEESPRELLVKDAYGIYFVIFLSVQLSAGLFFCHLLTLMTHCDSKSSLKNIIDSLLSPHQLPTVYYSPQLTRPKTKSNDAVVSFLGFQKVKLPLSLSPSEFLSSSLQSVL
jgi:hypothetical protein